MWFVAIGVLALVLKLLDVAPVGQWSWLLVLAPFAVAVAWWAWADASGLTQRKAMQRLQERQAARREKNVVAMGQGDPKKKRR